MPSVTGLPNDFPLTYQAYYTIASLIGKKLGKGANSTLKQVLIKTFKTSNQFILH